MMAPMLGLGGLRLYPGLLRLIIYDGGCSPVTSDLSVRLRGGGEWRRPIVVVGLVSLTLRRARCDWTLRTKWCDSDDDDICDL